MFRKIKRSKRKLRALSYSHVTGKIIRDFRECAAGAEVEDRQEEWQEELRRERRRQQGRR